MPRAIIYDDRPAGDTSPLAPLDDLRASFDIRTGALTNHERLRAVLAQMFKTEVAALHAPEPIAPLARERTNLPVNPPDLYNIPRSISLDHPSPTDSFKDDDPDTLLLINGRTTLPPTELNELQPNQILVQTASDPASGRSERDEIIAARLPVAAAAAFLKDFQTLPNATAATAYPDHCLLSRPWHTIALRNDALDIDLAILMGRPRAPLPEGVIAIEPGDTDPEGNDTSTHIAHIAPDATVFPTAVIDCTDGPVIIDDEATIRPGAKLIGPCYIGIRSTVLDNAVVRPRTAVGPVCKVNGEISGSIFQGFANKAHDGFLGDSWIGEWANLGASTVTSNLLNTYSHINATHHTGKRARTGLTFLGSILADHTRTAISTRLMTATTAHLGAMIAASTPPPQHTPPFAWITDDTPAGTRSFRLDKFLAVARTVMARRGLEPSDAYNDRIASLHPDNAPTDTNN
jgi:UDP-N-acetylglucosamine diphosphorylase/glucosamine-1-phosphate N-acetyltransferase